MPRLRVRVTWLLPALLAGCSTLPVIVPDLGRGPRRPVVVMASGEPQRVATSVASAGNAVTLLQNGPATYQAMLAALDGAANRVEMETYILEDDEVGRRFAASLVAARARGVEVDLLYDSAGSFATPAAFFRSLTDRGIAVLEFNPLNPLKTRRGWELNHRDHRKLLVVDGATAFLGGINISSVYSGGSSGRHPRPRADGSLAWRDTDIEIQGPAVGELEALFRATWSAQRGPALAPLPASERADGAAGAGVERVTVIGSSPDDPYSLIYATLLAAIGSARTSVLITNAYFVPDPQLLEALEAAARRGVAVLLILPGQSDSWLVLQAGRGYYDRLLRAGVRIYERQGAILHSKTALIDGSWVTVGSTNLDWRSFLHNQELNVVVLGTGFAAQVQAMFERDRLASTEVTLARWRQRSPLLRLDEWLARLWRYWL